MILTTSRQQQCLADYIHSGKFTLDPEDLNDAYYDIYLDIKYYISEGLNEFDIFQELTRRKLSDEGLKSAIDGILAKEPGHKEQYVTLADVGKSLTPVSWLWQSWIPRGVLTLLVADSGVGKTYVGIDIVRRVMHRLAAPDGQPLNIKSGRVIYIESENFLRGLFQRSLAVGIDPNKLTVFKKPDRDIMNLASREHQDRLLDMCYDLHPDLIIIDSFSASHTKSEGAIEDVRNLVDFLVDLSNVFDLALLVTHLLRKPQNGSGHQRITQHDVRGSGYLIQMSRTTIGGYMLTENKNGPRRLEVINTNLCKYPVPIDFNLVPAPHNAAEAMPEYSTTAIFDAKDDDRQPDTLVEECAIWLRDLLRPGPLSYADIVELARDEEYSQNTVQRARALLDWEIIDTIGPKARGNQWKLKETDENSKSTHASPGTHAKPTPPKNPPGSLETHTCTHAACVTPPPHLSGIPLTHAACLHVWNKNRQNGHLFPPKHHPGLFRQLFTRFRPPPRPVLKSKPVMCGLNKR